MSDLGSRDHMQWYKAFVDESVSSETLEGKGVDICRRVFYCFGGVNNLAFYYNDIIE